MALTEKQELEYMENEGLICPHCGGSNIIGGIFDELDSGMVERSVDCHDCNKKWFEVYSLFCITDEDSSESQLDKKDSLERDILQMPIRSAKELTEKNPVECVNTEILAIDCGDVN